MAISLDTPIQFLKGVGPRRAEAFKRMGVETVEDLLYHVPLRYMDASTVVPIGRIEVGQDVTVVGRVVSSGVMSTRKRLQVFRAVLQDDSGVIECAWPGQAFLDRTIKTGQLLLVSGPVKFFHGRQLNPREQIVLADEGTDGEGMREGVVLPVYHATEGLPHRFIRKLVQENLDAALGEVEEAVPADVIESLALPGLRDALRRVHRPDSTADAETGRRRLAFDELLDLQIVINRARQLASEIPKGPTFVLRKDLTTRLKDTLPFVLTGDQRRAVREIAANMTSTTRMNRLLMGDVGTGKTVVAVFAMLLALENGYQAVFMAPTELLVEQHGESIASLLAPLGIVPDVLLGRFSTSEKESVRNRIASGESRVIVGTHALIQKTTEFARLGLVVIDEQHRFGVEQRAALVEKGARPDVLLLTATPIPRSLALTVYGELDISTIREKPENRLPVTTSIRTDKQRDRIYRFITEQCTAGRQAYVVYPVIEESEKTDLRAATTMAAELSEQLAPIKVGLVHGAMKSEERDKVMRGFRDGAVSVLVATTVIEVGIDVANATLMVIEHPERFGLAQLHQLRGRVGRGAAESFCILLKPDGRPTPRLDQFKNTDDGFKIAELDLKERGMGELVGARQSGGLALKFTDLSTDTDLVGEARRVANQILEADPRLSSKKYKALRHRVERRYQRGMELFGIG